MDIQHLVDKYNVPAPRYTSYPTVPYWGTAVPTQSQWIKSVRASFKQSNQTDGISLYIHLPFCESLCTYCGCNTRITKNHQVEEPYIQSVLKEWTLYCDVLDEKPLIKEIHLGGGTPTFFNHDNLLKLINGILKKANVHKNAEFSFEAHPNNTTKDHLQTLFNLGFRRLSLGIQDFDPKVQFVINRMQSFEQVQTVTEQAREIGYTSINFDLIYGLPLQTITGLKETIIKTISLLPDRIAFYSYAHVPWVKPGQRRYTEAHLPSVTTKQELYEIGRRMFIEAGYEEIGMDHFALKTDSLFHAEQSGKLHRNFMGYTHQYTQLMISLGVSSISDTWFAFAQNVKVTEEYTKLIEQGLFPIFKGHTLTSEDLIIRKHILNLMCTGKTSWVKKEEQCDALFEGLERVQELVTDGLAQLTLNTLTVTIPGKRFLRNICMALDARLYANQPTTQLFSMAG
ncbi:MAG: oxygen-independent coproporphyrinogen III oxidase [Flavobacterium sp.]|nr:oxygen-independent coproporphyrinogen III oxidase [Pedobacter sp.]